MSHQLPDVQASRPDVTVGLNRVGVTGVEKLVTIDREGKRTHWLRVEFRRYDKKKKRRIQRLGWIPAKALLRI